MSFWQQLNPFLRGDIPTRPGCYVIFFNGEAVYVGQSNNLRSRFSRHHFRLGYARNVHTPWGELPDNVVVTAKFKPSRRLGDWLMWEIRLINRLQPDFNRTHKGQLVSGG